MATRTEAYIAVGSESTGCPQTFVFSLFVRNRSPAHFQSVVAGFNAHHAVMLHDRKLFSSSLVLSTSLDKLEGGHDQDTSED